MIRKKLLKTLEGLTDEELLKLSPRAVSIPLARTPVLFPEILAASRA